MYKKNSDYSNLIRLNKYLANAGFCSRRKADAYIQLGLIKMNGVTVTKLGEKISCTDNITFCNSPIRFEKKVYIILNKPKNCITTTYDPQGRFTVMDFFKKKCKERIFPVGRLDRNTTGVLLLTNDGVLSEKLTHPKYKKKKIYHVWLNRKISIADMNKLSKCIKLNDGIFYVDSISYINNNEDKTKVCIEIHSGQSHIVRRIFGNLDYRVLSLDRVYFDGLTKKNLKKGEWRFLSKKEITMLLYKNY
ncbi:MAG: rRNA pseudouridine synthase [Bacteroidales bacterium OttesenSCG-928-I14]|jgi:23S rRNA pseudouridine2605 synthase|nr:rRNA pseudouridine synthase [Bacteroidales bacterium OttesenSCG-928-I14]